MVVRERGYPVCFLKTGLRFLNSVAKKVLFQHMHVLNLLQDFFISCLRVLLGLGTKNKPLVRTDNSSSV